MKQYDFDGATAHTFSAPFMFNKISENDILDSVKKLRDLEADKTFSDMLNIIHDIIKEGGFKKAISMESELTPKGEILIIFNPKK